MPPHDLPRGHADLVADNPQVADARNHRDLAHRLASLPDGHPSAWSAADRARSDSSEPDRAEWWRTPADGELDDWAGEQDEAAEDQDDAAGESGAAQGDADGSPDDADPGDGAEADGLAGSPGGASRQTARGGRRTDASAEWTDGSGPMAHGAYRPWFSADTAGDPWFAASAGSSTGGPGG